jgi:tungstate transport system substrate-binding protein
LNNYITRKSLVLSVLCLLLIFSLMAGLVGCGQQPNIILATTTSTRDSGLLDVLLPVFEKESGYKVKTIAVGTGAALEMGKKGEADILMTHAPASEKPLVDEGIAIDYTLLMHNDFIFVGPASDPAGIKKAASADEALGLIAGKKSLFLSRGDKSGTHTKELQLWKEANVQPEGTWYQETGSGMGETLNIAAEKAGYTLTDRSTYLNLKKNLQDLEVLFEGDNTLFNIYHVMAVNPQKFDKANYKGAQAFIKFLTGKSGQDIITDYGKDKFGQPLFFSDVK